MGVLDRCLRIHCTPWHPLIIERMQSRHCMRGRASRSASRPEALRRRPPALALIRNLTEQQASYRPRVTINLHRNPRARSVYRISNRDLFISDLNRLCQLALRTKVNSRSRRLHISLTSSPSTKPFLNSIHYDHSALREFPKRRIQIQPPPPLDSFVDGHNGVKRRKAFETHQA